MTFRAIDLHQVYVDDESYDSGHGHAFDNYGFKEGNSEAIVVVRPDQCKSTLVQLQSGEVL